MLNTLKTGLHAVGEFQSRFILTVLYFLLLPLFSVIAKFSGDPLCLKDFHSRTGFGWLTRPPADLDLESARRQF